MPRRATRTVAAIVLLLVLSWFSCARAGTFEYGVDAGMGESDNVTLAHGDKTSQTIAVTDVDFDYLDKSLRLDVDAIGRFSYLDFLQNAYHPQLIGRFDGDANLSIVPQRVNWILQDDFGQAAIDPFTPTTPNNLENINYAATGPDIHLRFGGASFIDASARIAETKYATSPFSNTRGLASLAWGLKLSALSSASINADSQRVLFENTALNTDFNVTNVFARYEVEGARTNLSTDLGDTVVRANGRSTTGALAALRLSRTVSKAAKISLAMGRDTTDASASFAGMQSGAIGGVGAAAAANVADSFSRTYGSVGWTYLRNRTTLALSGRWEKDNYSAESALNRTQTTAELRLERLLRQAFTAQLTGRLYKTDYGNLAFLPAGGSPRTQTSNVAAALYWRPGRALDVKLAIEHSSYTTAPNDTGYQETRVFLTVGYRPRGASASGAASPSARSPGQEIGPLTP